MKKNKKIVNDGTKSVNQVAVDVEKTEKMEKSGCENNGDNLDTTEALKRFLKIALPFSFTRFLGMSSEFVGAVMLSKLSNEHLAASGLITVSNNLFLVNSAASVFSVSILQGQSLRKKRNNEIDELLKASLIYATVLGALNSIPLYFSGAALTSLLDQNDMVSNIVSEYFHAFIVSGGPIGFLTSVSFQQTSYALGKSNLVLAVNLLRRTIYLSLSYGLVMGEWGMPKLGAAGLAYANAISIWVDIIAFSILFKLVQRFKEFNLLNKDLKSSSKHLRILIKNSIWIASQSFNDFLTSLINTVIVGSRDLHQLSATEIANQYNTIISVPILCAGQATSIVMSQLGVDVHSSRKIAGIALASTSLILPLTVPILCALTSILSEPFLHDNSDSRKIQEITKTLLVLVAINEIPTILRNIIGGALRAKGDYRASALASLIGMSFVGLPAGLAMYFLGDMGAAGLYTGSLIGSCLGIGILAPFVKEKFTTKSESDEQAVEDKTIIQKSAEITEETILIEKKGNNGQIGHYSFWNRRTPERVLPDNEKNEVNKEEKSLAKKAMCTIL